MRKSDHDYFGFISELNEVAQSLRRFEQAQADAAQLAAKLSDSLDRVCLAAEGMGLLEAEAQAEAQAQAQGGDAEFARPSFFLARPPKTPVSEENLLRARAEMHAARDKALDAAKLLPMDALALRVQRLAAVVQDEGVRGGDLAPLSNAWMAMPVLLTRLMRETGKRVRIEIIGDGIFIERRLIPVLSNCLEALVENAVTRGIEAIPERARTRKHPEASVTILAACDNEGLSLTVADDGAGEQTAQALGETRAHVAALGGGIEALCMPGWGASVTIAIPAMALGAWRLHIEPQSALTSFEGAFARAS